MTVVVSLLRDLVTRLALPAIVLGMWWHWSSGSQSIYFPPLKRILLAVVELWSGGIFAEHVMPSLLRISIGYLVATVLGVSFGLAIGLSQRLRTTMEPVLEFVRAIPPPAIVPVVILLLGIGPAAKIFVIVSGAVWPILLNTVSGVQSIDPIIRDTGRLFGVRGPASIRHIVLPGASPQIVAGMRQSVPIAVILMVVSEMFASSDGIGFAIIQFQRTFAVPQMWAGMVMLGLLGVSLSIGFMAFERATLSWYFGLRANRR